MEHEGRRPLSRSRLEPAFLLGLAAAAVCWAIWAYPEKALFALLRETIPSRRDIAALHKLAGIGAACAFAFTVVGWLLAWRLQPLANSAKVGSRQAVHSVEALAVMLVVVLALALRVNGLSREFSYDELFSAHWFIAQDGSWWDTVASYRVFNNHILYSVFGRLAWLTIGPGVHDGSPSEWVIRLPALISGLAGVYLVWRCGREWVGREAAVLASLFLAALPIHVQQSQSARGYTGLLVCGLVSSWALQQLLERPGWAAVVTVVGSGTAAIYFHLYGAWLWVLQVTVVAAVAMRALVPSRADPISRQSFVRAWLALLSVVLISVLLYLPVIFQILREVDTRGTSDPGPAFPQVVAIELLGAHGVRLTLILMLIAVGACVGPLRRGRMSGYFVGLVVVPVVIMWRIVSPADLVARHFFYWLPYAMLMLAAGLLALSRAWPVAPRIVRVGGRCIAVTLALILIGGWLRQSATPFPIGPGYRAALASLKEGTSRDLPICAFGGDADLLHFYDNRLQLIRTEAEFEQFAVRAHDFACVYHDLPWSLPWEKALATKLAATSSAKTFTSIRVFRSRSEKQ